MDDRAARRRLETQMEAFLSSGMAQHEADELFRLVAELCPDRLDFREVCENLYDGIHITDGEGKVLFINKAYTRTTGIRPEDVHDEQMFIESSPNTVIEATIRVYEMLGAEVYLYFDYEGSNMTARVDPRTTARTGDTVKFALDAEKIHVFDKETELTITN